MTIDKGYKYRASPYRGQHAKNRAECCMTVSYGFPRSRRGNRDGRKRADHAAARERKPRAHRRVLEREHVAREPLRRSGEHTSELQSPCNLVCRLLLEK